MSIMTCVRCSRPIDTDFDLDSLCVHGQEGKCICKACRDQKRLPTETPASAPYATEPKLAALSRELEHWCRGQNLPFRSADELHFRDDITGEQRAWLGDFIERWWEADRREDERSNLEEETEAA
jgi:hypothetical protein